MLWIRLTWWWTMDAIWLWMTRMAMMHILLWRVLRMAVWTALTIMWLRMASAWIIGRISMVLRSLIRRIWRMHSVVRSG